MIFNEEKNLAFALIGRDVVRHIFARPVSLRVNENPQFWWMPLTPQVFQ